MIDVSSIYVVEYNAKEKSALVDSLSRTLQYNQSMCIGNHSVEWLTVGIFYDYEYALKYCRWFESTAVYGKNVSKYYRNMLFGHCSDLSFLYSTFEYSVYQRCGHIDKLGNVLKMNIENALDGQTNDYALLGIFEPDENNSDYDEAFEFGQRFRQEKNRSGQVVRLADIPEDDGEY